MHPPAWRSEAGDDSEQRVPEAGAGS